MYKKILLSSAILASTLNVALADPAPYLGGSIGIVTNTSSNAGNGQAGNFRGAPLNVFAGYGGVINQTFYLAGEVGGTLGTGELSNKNNLKTTYGYNFGVIPGVMLSDHTLAFARVGFVRSRFSNVSEMSSGGQVGLGMQTNLTQNVDLRGEYDFTAYSKVGGIKSPRQDAFNLGLVYKFN